MLVRLLLLGFLWLGFLTAYGEEVAQNYDHASIESKHFKQIVSYPLENKSLQGIEEIEALIQKHPNIPALYVLKCFLYLNFMFAYQTFFFEKEFKSTLKTGVKLSKKWLKQEPKNANAHFIYGALRSYQAMFLVRKKRFLQALGFVGPVLSHMRKAIKLGEIKDAYYALSQYHYYKYYFSKRFSWFSSAKDDQKKGYQYLQETIEGGFFMREEAFMSYLSMRIHDRNLGDLQEIIDEKIATYPNNIFYVYKGVEYCVLTGNWPKMLKHLQQVSALIAKEPKTGPSAYLRMNYYFVMVYCFLGDFKQANSYLEAFKQNQKNLEGWSEDAAYIKAIGRYKKMIKQPNKYNRLK